MRASICFIALALSGCGSVEPALKLARSAATFASVSDPVLRGVYESEQRACLSLPRAEQDKCITEVRAKWAPIKEGLREIRASWCEFEPEKCAAQDAARKGKP